MHYNMVSNSDFHSRRNRTAKFRMMNSGVPASELARPKSSINLYQRVSQGHAVQEKKYNSQSQAYALQPKCDRCTYSNHFADQIRFVKPRQSLSVNKDMTGSKLHRVDSFGQGSQCIWPAEPTNPNYSMSTTALPNCAGSFARLKTSPQPRNKPPVTPAIHRHVCDWNSVSLRSEFTDKLTPLQRNVTLYRTNLCTSMTGDTTRKDLMDGRRFHESVYARPCHRPACHTPHVIRPRKFKFKVDEPWKIKEEGDVKDEEEKKVARGAASFSNRNENSKSPELRRKNLRAEEVAKVLEMMAEKLERNGTNVNKELLKELLISLGSSPVVDRESKEGASSSLSSEQSSESSSSSSSVVGSTPAPEQERSKLTTTCNNNTKSTKQTVRKQHERPDKRPKDVSDVRTKAKLETSSSPPVRHRTNQTQPSLRKLSEPERFQSGNARHAKPPLPPGDSKMAARRESNSPRRAGDATVWNSLTIRRLKMAVDDLFENILETLRTDHSSVDSDFSFDQKEFDSNNRNNNSSSSNKNNINNDNDDVETTRTEMSIQDGADPEESATKVRGRGNRLRGIGREGDSNEVFDERDVASDELNSVLIRCTRTECTLDGVEYADSNRTMTVAGSKVNAKDNKRCQEKHRGIFTDPETQRADSFKLSSGCFPDEACLETDARDLNNVGSPKNSVEKLRCQVVQPCRRL